jgi:glycerol 2-dehydrogenase (NADP+)
VLSEVVLTETVALGHSVLAKSVNPSRIEQNRTIIDLDADDLAALGKISKSIPKRYVYPEFGVNFGFPDRTDGKPIS